MELYENKMSKNKKMTSDPSQIDFNSKKKFIRNQQTKVDVDFEQRYTLSYKANHLPSFYPFIQGKRH